MGVSGSKAINKVAMRLGIGISWITSSRIAWDHGAWLAECSTVGR